MGCLAITIKEIKNLKTKKGRDETGLFIVEGIKLVNEIPKSWDILTYVCSESYNDSITSPTLLRAPVITVSDDRFSSLSDTVTPQGIMAVCEKRTFSLQDIPVANPFFLIGECLNDPGNIGTLIRTAAAAGASGVILSENSGDIYNPKTIRAAAGAVLRIPIIEKAVLKEVIPLLKQHGITILAAHLEGKVLPYNINLQKSCAILVGNEASGLSAEASALCDVKVKLPMSDDIESLNASVAGGVLLYEVVRQRI